MCDEPSVEELPHFAEYIDWSKWFRKEADLAVVV